MLSFRMSSQCLVFAQTEQKQGFFGSRPAPPAFIKVNAGMGSVQVPIFGQRQDAVTKERGGFSDSSSKGLRLITILTEQA
jgi:hypothetical protein